MASWLTLSRNEALKIDGDGHPHGLAVLLRPEAPHADVHGLGARLGCQAGKEEGLLGEVVGLPALALVCGKPGDSRSTATLKTHTFSRHYQIKQTVCSVLDGLDLSVTLGLHSHNETPRVQYAVVVRTPQCPPPVITPVWGDKHIWVLRRWQRVTHSTWRREEII